MFRNPISIHLTMLGQNWQCYRTAKKNSPPIGVLEPQPTSKSGLGNLTNSEPTMPVQPSYFKCTLSAICLLRSLLVILSYYLIVLHFFKLYLKVLRQRTICLLWWTFLSSKEQHTTGQYRVGVQCRPEKQRGIR